MAGLFFFLEKRSLFCFEFGGVQLEKKEVCSFERANVSCAAGEVSKECAGGRPL